AIENSNEEIWEENSVDSAGFLEISNSDTSGIEDKEEGVRGAEPYWLEPPARPRRVHCRNNKMTPAMNGGRQGKNVKLIQEITLNVNFHNAILCCCACTHTITCMYMYIKRHAFYTPVIAPDQGMALELELVPGRCTVAAHCS
ncbi:hypothetical protein, partial [Salmonella sp. s51090]|uniref:hypothetical protein n=1 Tax=Salmonella sp. s51090 TaxID=3159651 RepID=UPI00397FAACB